MARPEKKSPESDPRRHRVAPALIVAALTVILSPALKSYTDLSSAYQMAIVGFGCASALLCSRGGHGAPGWSWMIRRPRLAAWRL